MNGINRYQNSYQALQSKATGKKQGIKKAGNKKSRGDRAGTGEREIKQ